MEDSVGLFKSYDIRGIVGEDTPAGLLQDRESICIPNG